MGQLGDNHQLQRRRIPIQRTRHAIALSGYTVAQGTHFVGVLSGESRGRRRSFQVWWYVFVLVVERSR
jgi:hypothetical protein